MNFPRKINIHYSLSKDLNSEIVKINKVLVKNYNNQINFSEPINMIPHITLIMGFLYSESDYINIITMIKKIKIQLFEFKFNKLVFTSNRRDYLFMYPNKIEEFYHIKKQVYNSISNLISPSKYGGVDNKPHLTLGYFKKFNDEIDLDIMTDQIGVFNNISIGITGDYGSCLTSEALTTYPNTM